MNCLIHRILSRKHLSNLAKKKIRISRDEVYCSTATNVLFRTSLALKVSEKMVATPSQNVTTYEYYQECILRPVEFVDKIHHLIPTI